MKITMAIGLGLALLAGGCGGDDVTASATKTIDAAPGKASGIALVRLEERSVEIGCGLCIYGMPDVDGCLTAAKVDGTPYLVEGSDLDAHSHGLCSGPAQAVVSGAIEDGKLVATSLVVTEESDEG